MKLSKQLPLNALRVFEAVARQGSFTRAGEELGMTQTAVSYQIKLLEEHIGEILFLRHPRQITLTDVGERLLPKVAEAFAMLNEAMSSAKQAANETLEIHSTPTFASHWLAHHLGTFQLEHPHIAVRLLRSTDLTDFNREPADVAIRIGIGPWPGLDCHPILRLSYTPMLSPGLADSIGGVRKPEDLLTLPWITVDDRWVVWFEAAGVKTFHHTGRLLDAGGALDLEAGAAKAGHGVAMLSRFYVEDELASGRLIQPFDLSWTDEKTYWLVYPQGRRNLPKIRAFREWLLKTLPPRGQA